MRAAGRGAAPGYCLVALEQTSGRGRQGRPWVAEPGGALLTSILAPCPQSHLTAIPLATGLAIHDALKGLGVTTAIKWPNDVLAGGAKLAGVLCEAVPRADLAIVGIGLNLAPVSSGGEFAASSIEALTGTAPCWQEALELLLPHLKHRWDQAAAGVTAFRTDWLAAATGIGQTVSAVVGDQTVTGVAEDIDDTGSLLIRTAGGVVGLLAAEVHLGSPRL